MDLATWVKQRGKGALTELQNKSGLAYTTILSAVKRGPGRVETAQKISDATDGEVSLGELMKRTGTEG